MYFNLPNVVKQKQIPTLLNIIQKQREELVPLRKEAAALKTIIDKLKSEVKEWKEESGKWKEKYQEKQRENTKLQQEIERLTKTNSRYQVSLFDHGNFKHQDEKLDKRLKGGQLNHPDTNREGRINFPGYENYPRRRIYAKSCGKCGNLLKRVNGTREKVLLDIIIKPEIIQMIIGSERQWCGNCKVEVNGKYPNSLPFSEYGLNTLLMVMVLRFKAHCSLRAASKVIDISFGLKLSKSDISNLLKMAAKYLGGKYEELKQAVRDGEVIYMDETGWLVKGGRAWMWIMANEEITVYVPAESRGKGIAEDMYGNSQAKCVTDGLASYTNSIPKDKHCFCWAHMLRFSFEETIHSNSTSDSAYLRDELVRIYRLKQHHPEYSKKKLAEVLAARLNRLLTLPSQEQSFKNIQGRLKEQKMGLILSLLETGSGTNNLAERELRELVLGRKISFGSDTYTGMQTTAVLSSVIQTLGRGKQKDLTCELTLNLQIGIHEKYSQYTHLAYFDSS